MYQSENSYNAYRSQHYRGAPAQGMVSPPLGYGPSDQLVSPVSSSAAHPLQSHSEPYSRSYERLQEQRYTDEAPPPPRHGADMTPSDQHPSTRKPVPAAFPSTDNDAVRGRPEQPTYDAYSRDHDMAVNPALRPPHTHMVGPQDHSRGSSPYRHPQRPSSRLPERNQQPPTMAFGAVAATPGSITPARTPEVKSSRMSERSMPLTDYSSSSHNRLAGPYNAMPYYNSSHDFDPTVSNASINPQDIADDGDDGFMPDPKRRSVLSIGKSRGHAAAPIAGAGTAAAVGAGAGVMGALYNNGKQSASGTYRPVNTVDGTEKDAPPMDTAGNKRKRRIWIGLGVGIVIVLAIVGAIVGGVLGTRKSGSSASGGSSGSGGSRGSNGPKPGSIQNANTDTTENGDLDINSAEIKSLMDNPDFHKVFPGIDYTPWGVQYPLCNVYPPSQNNVTRDVAVLSQLTNTIRLYGTDCNQTEMVLHAFDRLQLKDMKLWLGVWIDTNQTTKDRQMNHLYSLLANIEDRSILKGVIIGNEALFRAGESKAEAQQEITTLLVNTRQNFTTLGYDLPVGTSDLGDNWDTTLAQASDFVMSNIHPFFAGVSAEEAAAWTWNFWQREDVPLTANLPNVKQVISETGWPSSGGTDCGGTDGSCAPGQSGATASVENMNIFMNDWVCQALENGTEYFWFEAFDEPWKIQYNTPGREWEDKWGLMDSGRNLKPGIKIPDCGGKTAP